MVSAELCHWSELLPASCKPYDVIMCELLCMCLACFFFAVLAVASRIENARLQLRKRRAVGAEAARVVIRVCLPSLDVRYHRKAMLAQRPKERTTTWHVQR